MKIFNWVHKRFNHKSPKDGFASSEMKMNEVTMSNNNNNNMVGDNNNNNSEVALLKQVALTNMLGGWKDGILTIGTLGYDHKEYFGLEVQDKKLSSDEGLYNNNNHNNNSVVDYYYYAEENDEELNPLMLNTFEHHNNNFDDDNDEVLDAKYYNAIKKEEEEVVGGAFINNNNEIVLAADDDESNDDDEDVESDDQKKKKKNIMMRGGERITLADLFLADSEVKKQMMGPTKILVEPNDGDEKSNPKGKHGKSFAKKLIPNVKDNPQPMKDIKKLMKKMLKRKIHPDFDAKNHKPENKENGDHTKKNEGKASIYCIPI